MQLPSKQRKKGKEQKGKERKGKERKRKEKQSKAKGNNNTKDKKAECQRKKLPKTRNKKR